MEEALAESKMPRESHADPRLRGFGTVLVLSAPYGATAGGMATRIGAPPNALLAAYMNSVDGTGLRFGRWMRGNVSAPHVCGGRFSAVHQWRF